MKSELAFGGLGNNQHDTLAHRAGSGAYRPSLAAFSSLSFCSSLSSAKRYARMSADYPM